MVNVQGYSAVPTWLIRDSSVKRSAVLVYASLASRSGLGAIFPSQDTIALEAGVSVRTVRSALQELEALGVVERVRRRAPEGLATTLTTAYVLHPNGRIDLPAESAGSVRLPAEATGNQGDSFLPIEVTNSGTRESAPRKHKPHPLPADWEPSDEAVAFARDRGLDVAREADAFRAHAEANAREVVVWHAAFRQWLIKARPVVAASQHPSQQSWGDGDEWMGMNR